MKEETGQFIPFILAGSSDPLSGSHIHSILFFLPFSALTSAPPKLPAASDPTPPIPLLPEIASDALDPESAAKLCLQSHCRTLALELAERILDRLREDISQASRQVKG